MLLRPLQQIGRPSQRNDHAGEALGGGRTRPQDAIDHAVGIVELAGIGDTVGPDRPLGIVHARDEAGFSAAQTRLRAAYRLGDGPVERGPLIIPVTEASQP